MNKCHFPFCSYVWHHLSPFGQEMSKLVMIGGEKHKQNCIKYKSCNRLRKKKRKKKCNFFASSFSPPIPALMQHHCLGGDTCCSGKYFSGYIRAYGCACAMTSKNDQLSRSLCFVSLRSSFLFSFPSKPQPETAGGCASLSLGLPAGSSS